MTPPGPLLACRRFFGERNEVPWSFETEVRRLWDFYFSAGVTGSSRSGGASEQGEGAAHVAQLVEHVLGKDEVTGSIPVMGSTNELAAGQRKPKKTQFSF